MKTPSKPSESRPSDVKKAKYRVTNWPDQQIETKGLAAWKKESGYHQRSLAENAMYRLKQLFGDHLASRLFETQVVEVHARIAAMNRMTYLGMSVSVGA
jgi:hypothetical protein